MFSCAFFCLFALIHLEMTKKKRFDFWRTCIILLISEPKFIKCYLSNSMFCRSFSRFFVSFFSFHFISLFYFIFWHQFHFWIFGGSHWKKIITHFIFGIIIEICLRVSMATEKNPTALTENCIIKNSARTNSKLCT